MAITFQSKIIKITDLTPSSKSFIITTPAEFIYQAGQFVMITLEIAQSDGSIKKIKRSYSIASTPTRSNEIELAIKLVSGGALTTWLFSTAKIGTFVEVSGPFGNFFLKKEDKPKTLYLISAGSGVAPVLSIMRDQIARGGKTPIVWISSNKLPNDIEYVDEIRVTAANHKIPTLFAATQPCTDMECHLGRIDKSVLEKMCPTKKDALVFMCGPPVFVDAISAILIEMGFDASQVRKEKF